MKNFWSVITDNETGLPIPNCNVYVYIYGGTTLATIYSDDGVTPKANPFEADANGRYNFYVVAGKYYLKFVKAGFNDWTSEPITIPDEVDETDADTVKNKYVSNNMMKELSDVTLRKKNEIIGIDNIQCQLPMPVLKEIFKAGGSGDMLKSVYDTDADGIVDNSEKLESLTAEQIHKLLFGKFDNIQLRIPNELRKYFTNITGLSGLLADRQRPPCVWMIRRANDDAVDMWEVYKPDGTKIDISASTTRGLQEAINYACQYGYDLEVFGGGIKTVGGATDVAVINCYTSVVFPPMQNKKIRIGGVTLNFNADVGADLGLSFDSCMMVDFEMAGQIVYQGTTGAAVQFAPVNPVPYDLITVIQDSHFKFMSLGNGGTGAVVRMLPSGGNIGSNYFNFVEILEGFAGLLIENSTHQFTQNFVRAVHIHDQNSGVQVGASIGDSVTNAERIAHNTFDLSINTTTGGTALRIFGKNNLFTTMINQDVAATTGILLEASAEKNIFNVLKNSCSTPVNDTSTTKDNEGIYGSFKPRFSAHKNGTNQTDIVTATFTKVTFGTEEYDKGSCFADSKWTPGRIGIAQISSRLGWVTVPDAFPFFISIYRNGSEYRRSVLTSSSTEGTQGPEITHDVPVNAITDYFEIYAYQGTGENRDIHGSSLFTWFTGHMVD